jgi:hypothetical protein
MEQPEKRRFRCRRKRQTMNLGAHALQPPRQPTALEAGMPREQNPAALPEVGVRQGWRRTHPGVGRFHQVFQGA